MQNFLIITFFTIVASAITTLVGFGVGTIMTPILVLFLPYEQALIVVGWIHMASSFMKMMAFRKYIDWSILLMCAIPAMFVSVLGAGLITFVDRNLFVRFLGGAVLVYVLLEFLNPTFSIRKSSSALIIGGAITGFSAGFFGLRGILVAMMLSSFGLTKEIFIGVTGAFSVLVDIVRLAMYHYNFVLPKPLIYELGFYVPLSLLIVHVSSYVVAYISVPWFKRVLAFALSLVGLKLLIFGV
ncbi:TSUP family transporter [Candidatus Dependentiae bacterium]|nr:TSUP family transporter [Candidatus Dependentiae bacterium]